MNIEIHSFQSARRLKPNANEKTVIIRISDPDYNEERDAELLYRKNFEDVCKVSFHDLTDKQVSSILAEEPHESYQAISIEQANEILSFVDKHKDCDNLIIHCSAGISRSPAVAIGIARHLKDKEAENEILESQDYLPNQTVIERITEASMTKNS